MLKYLILMNYVFIYKIVLKLEYIKSFKWWMTKTWKYNDEDAKTQWQKLLIP